MQYENDGTFTHKQKFANVPLVFTEEPASVAAGQVEVKVPWETWPTYETARGALRWTLRFEGTAPRHAKLREEFIIHIEAKDKAWVPPPPLDALLSGDLQHAASVAVEQKRRDWQVRFMG